MGDPDVCDECGGLKHRYGLFDCDEPFHPKRSVAEDCMADIEADMRDRRGFGFGSFDDEIQWKIRDTWIAFIERAQSRSDVEASDG